MFTHGSLFSGIGGFDLAAQWLGWYNIFQVEKDEWCLSKLAKNFPNVHRYTDIQKFDGTQYKHKITVLSGGFPCQPFSLAGNQKGRNDERHLWPEMLRVIREVEPIYVVAENVPGLVTNENGMVFKQVLTDLENQNYKVQTFDIPACGKNAIHKRSRIWIVAHANDCTTKHEIQTRWNVSSSIFSDASHASGETFSSHNREQEVRQIQQSGICTEQSIATNTSSLNVDKLELQCQQTEWQKHRSIEQVWRTDWRTWSIKPTICRNDDGVSNRVDRIKALGNAIVPQIAYELFKNIQLAHQNEK